MEHTENIGPKYAIRVADLREWASVRDYRARIAADGALATLAAMRVEEV